MKCTLSISINKGSRNNVVREYGAKVISKTGSTGFDSNMKHRTYLPSTTDIKKADSFDKVSSYVFSNNVLTDESGIDRLLKGRSAAEKKKVKTKLRSSGGNLYKGIANDLFKRNPDMILSPTPANSTQIISYGDMGNTPDSDTRTFFRITEDDVIGARAHAELVHEGLGDENDPDNNVKEIEDTFKEGMEFAIISALYRGFDISLDYPIDSDIINSALNRYNKYLKETGTNVQYVSQGVNPGIPGAANLGIRNYIEELKDSVSLKTTKSLYTGSKVLSGMLSDTELTTYNRYKKASNASKVYVLEKLTQTFTDMMPGIKAEVMTPSQIFEKYGEGFYTEKGFIIGGNIVLNSEYATAETAFHEFGHFYMNWLKTHNEAEYNALLEKVAEEFEGNIADYTTRYNKTGLQFSQEDILVEIFLDEIGLLAAQELEQELDESDRNLEDSIEAYVNDFVRKITRDKNITADSVGFGLNTTIAQIFDIGIMNIAPYTTPPLFRDIDAVNLDLFRQFMITKPTARQLFNGLSMRGVIQKNAKGEILLMDTNGNRYNADGELDPTAKYKIYDEDSSNNIRKNDDLMEKIDGYLEKFKNEAQVLFSKEKLGTKDVAKLLRDHSEDVELNKGTNKYKKGKVEVRRTTEFAGSTFGTKTSEDYVLIKLYYNRLNEYKNQNANNFLDDDLGLETAAAQHAIEYMENKGDDWESDKAEIESIFNAKAGEGTFLHTLGEFYFRVLNYTQKIPYNLSLEDGQKPGYLYFSDQLIDAITSGPKALNIYMNKYLISRISDKGSKEYTDMMEAYTHISTSLEKGKDIKNTEKFFSLLKSEVLPELNKLPGPLDIIPELQMFSEAMGLGGKLDLAVIDGTGRAHIFDYKNKVKGKSYYWDYRSSVKMDGVMSGYSDNSMMQASVQTSIYRLMFKELGIDTAPAHVFYVENDITGTTEDSIYKEMNPSNPTLEYTPTSIKKKGLIDVSGELLHYFRKEEGREGRMFDTTDRSQGLVDVLYRASGNKHIDHISDVTARAQSIYDSATKAKLSPSDDAISSFIAKIKKGKDMKDGLKVTISPGNHIKLTPGISEQRAIKEIEEILIERRDLTHTTAEFINVFNGFDRDTGRSNYESTRDNSRTFRGLLVDADPNTHEITKMSSNSDYGTEVYDMLFLKNNITKGTRAIMINTDKSYSLGFGRGRSNIFGNYITDTEASTYFPKGYWTANSHNMRLIKLGLVIAQQKLVDPNFNLEVVMHASTKSNRGIPTLQDIPTVLKYAKTMLEIMQKSGEVLPKDMQELLDNPRVFDSTNYIENPVNALAEYLNIASGPLFRNSDISLSSKVGMERKENLRVLMEKYSEGRDDQELLASLIEFKHSLDLADTGSSNSKLSSDIWTLTDQVIFFLSGLPYLSSPENTDIVNNYLTPGARSSNMYQSFLTKQISSRELLVREDYIAFKNEHNKLIEDVAESRGITLGNLGSNLYTYSRKRIFDNLYEFDNNKDPNKAYRLRDPNNPGKVTAPGQTRLNAAEIKYLRFFRDSLQNFSEMGSHGGKPIVPYGFMPLVPRSRLSNAESKNPWESIKDRYGRMRRDFSLGNEVEKKDINVELEFEVSNPLQGQVPVDATKDRADENYTPARRDMLGVDESGNKTRDVELDRFEDNLENVLDIFAMGALEANHYKDVSALGKAMLYNIKRYERLSGGASYDDIIKTLVMTQKRIVKHETNDKFRIPGSKTLDSLATSVVTVGTMSQALLETISNPAITADVYIADLLYGKMFKGTREFSSTSFLKAVKIVWNPIPSKDMDIVNALDKLYGITNADTANLKSVLNSLEENSLFQTKKLMFINKIMLENWQKITMTAYMLEQGSFYAHSIDDDDRLVYDEKKDGRFNAIGGTALEKADKKAIYLAHKKQMERQRNGLTGTSDEDFNSRKMKRAFTDFEAGHIKELIVEAYSSMDEASKSLSSFYSLSKIFYKMRNWLIARIPRYFRKPMSADENIGGAKLVKVIDNSASLGYRYEWRGTEVEGIVYTLKHIAKELQINKFNVFKKGHVWYRHEEQKKNMSRLSADVLMLGFLHGMAAGLWAAIDDEDKKKESYKLLHQRMIMSAGDVFLPMSIYETLTGNGSLWISASIASRAFNNMIDSISIGVHLSTGSDEYEAADLRSSLDDFGRSVNGVYKTASMANEISDQW